MNAPTGASFLWEPAGSREIVTPERFTDEQKEIARAGREFSDKEILPRLREIESKKAGLIPELLKKAGELGLLMVDIPEAYGGLGLGKTTSMLLAEQFSACGSFSVSLGGHTGIGTLPIVYFGTDDQKRRYLPDLGTGKKLAAYALTEAGSGSDALAARTTAVLAPDGKHYLINGSKQFITNAGFADVFVVFAKVAGPNAGEGKLTGFIVDRTSPGLTIGPEEHKMGIRGSSTCPLVFEDVKVPVENLLGELGKGHKIAFNTLNVGRIKLGVGTTGACKYAIEIAAKYARERKQFGKPIAGFGLVADKLAEMALATFVAETVGYRTTGLVDERLEKATTDPERVDAIEEFTIEASLIKVFGSEALSFCADEAVQIHGGYGFIEEFDAERIFRDSRINRIFEGTNEINRLIVPATLLKRAMKQEIPLMGRALEIRASLAKGQLPEAATDELRVAEYMKWLTIYTLSVVAETYTMKVADEQEVLGAIADMIGRCYALDSVLTRIAEMPVEHKAFARDLLTAYAPRAYGNVFHNARHILFDVCDEKSLGGHLDAVGKLRMDWRAKVIAAKRRIAAAVVEKGGYPL